MLNVHNGNVLILPTPIPSSLWRRLRLGRKKQRSLDWTTTTTPTRILAYPRLTRSRDWSRIGALNSGSQLSTHQLHKNDVARAHEGELLPLDLYFCCFYTDFGENDKQMQQSRCLQMFDWRRNYRSMEFSRYSRQYTQVWLRSISCWYWLNNKHLMTVPRGTSH